MEKSNKSWWLTVGMIVTVLVPIGLYASLSVKPPAPGQYDEQAKCLTQKGVKMYGAYWCSHCTTQKKMWGDSFEYIDYVECAVPGSDEQLAVCTEAGINSYPTWVFSGEEKVEGEMTIEQLTEKTGC